MIKEIKFYNSLTKQKEIFIPIEKNKISMYSCGPTVYNYAHIGNFRAYVFSDILHRILIDAGYDVKFVMNLTDVDDKTIRDSKAQNIPLAEYTQKYKDAFFEDIKTLNIKPAFCYPSATENIKEMIDIIKLLEEKGHTYEAEGSIYFKISTFAEYGNLAGLDKQILRSGASGRILSDEYEKENASDFVLWKAYTPADGDVYWDSPYGKGRPGWHIECSAMSSKYLSKHFDIHTGGVDNKFPHHENEIAQNECAFNEKFVNYWLHCEHLIVDGEKMSKSKGNFYTLRDLLNKNLTAKAIRYSLMTSHYKKQLNFTIEGIEQSDNAIERVNDFAFRVANCENTQGDDDYINDLIKKADDGFSDGIYDDINISEALGHLFTFIKICNSNFDKITINKKDEIINFLNRVNGIIDCFDLDTKNNIVDDEIEKLIENRNIARQNKDYKTSDEIRAILLQKGIEILDTPSGVQWKRR